MKGSIMMDLGGNSMALQKKGMHGAWARRWTFIMAATGSAVGLGNMWKFPYVAGSNGGGAFVIIYLLCILMIGVPVMMAEVMIGRQGRQSPINSMKDLISEHARETGSLLSKNIISDFEKEIENFLIVCPKEMLDKLKNPITLKSKIKAVS